MNKVHVIVNPYSGRGKTGRQWNLIKEAVQHHFKEFKYIFTEKPKQATDIARELLKDGFDLIIGVGGDGTLNEIVNGFFKHNSGNAVNDDASVGIIPSGTGSDFVRFLKIPRDFNRSVETIKHGETRKIDVGKITYQGAGPNGEDTGTYFINIADFGMGAEAAKKLADTPPNKRGALFYYKVLLSTLRTYHAKKVNITLDDNELIQGRFMNGAIANGRIFGGGMKIAPKAEPDDGLFDLVLVKDMKRLETILNTPILYTGGILKHPKVIHRQAKKITVTADEKLPIEYDGEPGHTLPATFEIMEKRLNFKY